MCLLRKIRAAVTFGWSLRGQTATLTAMRSRNGRWAARSISVVIVFGSCLGSFASSSPEECAALGARFMARLEDLKRATGEDLNRAFAISAALVGPARDDAIWQLESCRLEWRDLLEQRIDTAGDIQVRS